MLTSRIKADGVCPLPTTYQFVRLAAGVVEVSTTEGMISVECDRPRILLRDMLADYFTEIHASMHVGRAPLDYSIYSVQLSERRNNDVPGLTLIPDNVPLTKGIVLMETAVSADYHDFESLQVIGIKRCGGLIVGFSSTSYEIEFAPAVDVGKAYRELIERDFLTDEAGHFTTHANEDFLNWTPVKRVYCREIVEVQHRPDSWGRTAEILTDLRGDPAHAACRARMTPSPGRSGIDI